MNTKQGLTGVEVETVEKLIEQSIGMSRTNPHKGIELAEEALNASDSDAVIARALVCKGACQVWLGNYETSLQTLFEALGKLEGLNDHTFEAHALYHVFCAFYFLADYDNALKYAHDMLGRAEKSGDINAQANALNGIGSVYYTSGENQKAIEALTRALSVAERLEDKHLLARIFDGLGAAHFNINDIERAIDFKERALETARPIGLKNVESYALDGLARIYMAANAFKLAEKLFLDCLSIREEINFKSGIAETNLHLGDLFMKTETYDKALKHLNTALSLSSETNTKEVIYKSHEALSRYYEKQRNTEKFIEHFKNYYAYKEEYFSEKNKQKLKGVEMQISISQMEKEKALLSEKNKQLEQKSKDLVVLSDLGKEIISQLSIESINNTVYTIISNLMDAHGFGIGVLSEDGTVINFPGYIENGEVLPAADDELDEEHRLSAICFKQDREIVISDFDKEIVNYVKQRRAPNAGQDVQSIVYLPLRIADKKIGVLTVQSFNKNAFSDYQVNLVKNLAVYSAIAIENATSYEKLEERVKERTAEIEKSHENTRLLSEIGQQIISSTNFDSIFQKLHENVSKLMNADCFSIRTYDEEKQEIDYRYGMEKGKLSERVIVSMDNHDNFSVWCVRNKKEIFINDNLNEYQRYTSKIVVPRGEMPHSLLFCPMTIGERIVGVITVQSFEKHAYVPMHMDILKTLGSYTAIALENASLVENLEDKVKERTSEVVKQKEIIEETNKHITDSIKYAKRIQEAFLPSENSISEHLKNAFILYKPKDIVSGDFYWIERKENKILFAVVDCTGHGVPGAFMSIIGFNGLNQIVNEYNYTKPADILTHLNKRISNTLKQRVEDSKIRDGMDVAICSIDLEKNKLEFAGAFSPLFILRNNEVLKFKGDKHPIGNFVGTEDFVFTNNEIDLLPDDRIYIFSDGFVDQFGGPAGKKLKYNYFRQLLLDNHKLPMVEQKEKINEFFEAWKSGFEQIDDVCIIGVAV
jgi:serine phosphatase RsbU (regulator of sigma subunit)/tetratricopeptide (TPR) repeat protein/GAF domain-containing protein